jgi:hypothetical protein
MLVKLWQELNALFPIAVTEVGMVTLVKFQHSRNAALPIAVTEDGMVTLVKLKQALKAHSPIAVTGNPSICPGMFSVVAFPLYPVMVTLLPSIIRH